MYHRFFSFKMNAVCASKPTFGLFVCCVYLCYAGLEAKIIGGFVLPHGGIALDPRNFNTSNATELLQARLLHEACLKVGEELRRGQPDIVVISTPHGLSDYRNFLLYANSEAAGYGEVDDCLYEPCQYNLTVKLDSQLTQTLVSFLGYDRNVSALSAFGPLGNDNAVPLRWGEVIPLTFLGNLSSMKVVILSQPTRRYTEDIPMIPELLKLGGDMFPLLEETSVRVAVVISADLAHTHKASGPYGYSNASQPFDDAVGEWANTLNGENLLVDAARYVDKALSCGYTGLVMLHGLLSKISLSSWQPRLYANFHPSYYGMMAASFVRIA